MQRQRGSHEALQALHLAGSLDEEEEAPLWSPRLGPLSSGTAAPAALALQRAGLLLAMHILQSPLSAPAAAAAAGRGMRGCMRPLQPAPRPAGTMPCVLVAQSRCRHACQAQRLAAVLVC